MKFFKIILGLCFMMNMVACDTYLDVSNELAGGVTSLEQVFENANYSKRWYANVMTGIPDYSSIINVTTTGVQNPWTSMTDEICPNFGDVSNYCIASKNSSNVGFHRWGILYQLIRQANIFLEKGKPVISTGVDAVQLTEEEFNKMKVNAQFMRAYYHYLLFEQYGPIPIVTRSLSVVENIDLPRNAVDEVVKFINDELNTVIPLLPQSPITDDQYRVNPTKGVALAVRAKLWMYAASPLLNGGYPEALALTDTKGNKLFPAADPNKWKKALAATKDLIDYSKENYDLYREYTNGVLDPDKSVYNVFQVYNNSEIIWSTSTTSWGGADGMAGGLYEPRCTPRSEPNGNGNTAVLQSLVDDFYMKDGLPITNTDFLPASKLYSEVGTSLYNGVNVFNMWINREPRFYNTVFFEGRKWHISNKVIYFHAGSANDCSAPSAPLNGYLLYKRFNKRVHMTSPGVKSVFRPSIIFRLAEFYLLYAEALNEVEPANSDVLKYLNLVRERAGIPAIETLNPAIVSNQNLQRKAIQRESRIELATEGQRYFDVRRWMIAEQPEGAQGGDQYGMNMSGNEANFFTRTKFQTRVFERKQYLYPIAYDEMQKSTVLVQNPGW